MTQSGQRASKRLLSISEGSLVDTATEREMTEETFQLTDGAAAIYEDQKVPAVFRPLARATLDAVPIHDDERVLDVACGTGIVAREIFARLGPTAYVTGVDLNEGMIEVARKLTDVGSSRCEWHVSDVSDLPFARHSFSLAICQQGIQYFPDEDAALREIHRVLMPDGRVVITIWAGANDFFKVLAAALSKYVSDEIGQRSLAPFTYSGLRLLPDRMSKSGFRDVSVQTITVMRTIVDPQLAIPKEIMGNPVGPSVAAKGQEVMGKIVREVIGGLAHYHDGAKIVLPQDANLITAKVC